MKLPLEIQSKILSYFKFNVDYCFNFMRVSKSFKHHVELMHIDIYNISLGLCSKLYWRNKTLAIFTEMVDHFEAFTDIPRFNRYELMEVYTEGSLFRIFLHLFFCKRSCDRVDKYCWKCSLVRDRNFQNILLFDDVLLADRDFPSKLGLDNRLMDFDVFLTFQKTFSSVPTGVCDRERTVQYAADVYVLFVSIFIRVNLNVFYDFFLKIPLCLQDERYFVRKIQFLVRDLSNMIWETNVNYFFVIFDKFFKLNHCACYDVDIDKPLNGPYTPLGKVKQYYGQLSAVSNSVESYSSDSSF